MKKLLIMIGLGGLLSLALNCTEPLPSQTDYPVKAVSFSDVDITDDFWAPKMEVNRTVSILHCFDMHEETESPPGPKYIESAAYMLAKMEDPQLEAFIDDLIDRSVERLESRLRDNPESAVRISGHFLEAAVAYYEATGKRKMLDAAVKAVDKVDEIYGPGKKTFISGHEGFKIGLIRLYRHTGEKRYLNLARFFLDERGKDDYERQGEYALDRTYAQDHLPVVDQTEVVGHCVRAVFLYIALTDIAALTGEPAYSTANERLWQDSVFKKTYLTGGVGSIRFHEQYGAAYELPNLSAWNETCAAYGNVVWNHRLFLEYRDAKYIDMLERVLYNGWLVGVSLRGDRFFYQNPLKSFGNYERFRWINVPCCPPNIVRLMASIGSYIYAKEDSDIYVNLFIGSRARIETATNRVLLTQNTRYPWDGKVRIFLDPEQEETFTVLVRIPLWTRNQPMPGDLYRYMQSLPDEVSIRINGDPAEFAPEAGYARLKRRWRRGDIVDIEMPMPVRKVLPHPGSRDNEGLVALERGPLVYCAEWPDNRDGHVMNLLVPDDAVFVAEFQDNLLGGVMTLKGQVSGFHRDKDGRAVVSTAQEMKAIPYFAWANRGMGEMAVWLPRQKDRVRTFPVIPPSPIALVKSSGGIEKTSTGYHDQNDDISALYDGFDPLNSADESNLYFRMRPPEGQPAWLEYWFHGPVEVSSTEVFWVDDRRFCRLPRSWRILFREGDAWTPVDNQQPFLVEKDRFCTVRFTPVTTNAIRMEVEPESLLYTAGMIGPPAAMFIDRDVVWREFGIIECRISGNGGPMKSLDQE